MRHARFVIIILAICLGGYAALLALGRSSVYCSRSKSFFDTAPCFQAETRGQKADILLVGDSSLLYGISPAEVADAGGGSTYNLGMVGPSFGFRPRNLIDRYLARNARPKAIILYFAPWHLISDRKIADPQWAPLGVYLLRHGSAGDLLRFVSINPAALVELPPILLTGLTSSGRKASAYRGDLVRNRGYLDYNARGKVKPLPANCSPASYERRDPYAVDNRAEVAALRAHYARLGLPVFVYVAPIATCDARIDEVRRAYAGVSDAVPQALPNPFFADDSKRAEHVHPSPAGASEFSRRLADFIKTVVQPKTAEPKVIPPAS